VCVLAPVTDWTTETMKDQITALHAAFEHTLAHWPTGEPPAASGAGVSESGKP
jgi:hypothetical protein